MDGFHRGEHADQSTRYTRNTGQVDAGSDDDSNSLYYSGFARDGIPDVFG